MTLWTQKHWQMVEGTYTSFWETSRGVLRLGYISMPNLGPSDMPVIYKPIKTMIFQQQDLIYLTKKSEYHLISLWNLDFLWVFSQSCIMTGSSLFWGKKSSNFFFIADVCFKEVFPPPAASFPQNQSQVILVTPCLYLSITTPKVDANIAFFVKSTSHAHVVT